MFSILRFTLHPTHAAATAREKEATHNQLIFWQSVKDFSNRKPINCSLHKQKTKKKMKWKRERDAYPKGTVCTQKPKKKLSDFKRAQCSVIDASLSHYCHYFVQHDDYCRHKSNVNQFMSVCVCMCFVPGRSFCKLSTQTVCVCLCLILAFLSIWRNCSVSLAVLPTIVIAQTISSKRIQSKRKEKIELHKCTFMCCR